MIEAIRLDGDVIDLADVFASVTLRHGREDVDADPIGSTATLSLVNVDAAFTAAFRVGRELAIDTVGAVARFRGRITDAALNTDDPDEPTLSILAVSTLARLSGRKVGQTAWPSERWSARVERALVEAGAAPNLFPGASLGQQTWQGDWGAWLGGISAAPSAAEVLEGATSMRVLLTSIDPGGSYVGHSPTFTNPRQGPLRLSFWAKGVGASIGQPFFLRLNESGGVIAGDQLSAGVDAPLPAEWTRFESLGQIAQPDRGGAYTYTGEPVAGAAGTFYIAGLTITRPDEGPELVLEVGSSDPMVAARAADETTLADVLQELAQTVPAAIADLPDGRILVQAVSARARREAISLDPDLVVFAPEWAQSDDVANVVRVEWSGGTFERTDPSSVAEYDERAPLVLSTLLTTLADVEARSAIELNRRARPDWRIDHAELLELDADLGIGSAVLLTELPAASPRTTHIGMLEGWTDHVEAIAGELEWTMTLSLSPQRLSGHGFRWNELPAGLTWDEAASATWDDVQLLEGLS